jgi:hypothetical protein
MKEGKPTLATHVALCYPDIPEIIGNIGLFDYVEFVGEESTYRSIDRVRHSFR